jgi:hypothetical protein
VPVFLREAFSSTYSFCTPLTKASPSIFIPDSPVIYSQLAVMPPIVHQSALPIDKLLRLLLSAGKGEIKQNNGISQMHGHVTNVILVYVEIIVQSSHLQRDAPPAPDLAHSAACISESCPNSRDLTELQPDPEVYRHRPNSWRNCDVVSARQRLPTLPDKHTSSRWHESHS